MCEYPDHSSRLKASYAGQAARRALSELPPGLYKEVMGFAETGLPATTQDIAQWLEGKNAPARAASI